MNFLRILAASLLIGIAARPHFLSEEAQQAAVVCLFVMIVVRAVERTERHHPINPTTAKLLAPLRRKFVYAAIQLYACSWFFAHIAFGRLAADLFK